MRILQLNGEAGWRGGERQTLLCMRQFRAAGHDAVLLARADAPLARAARDDGFEVHTAAHALGLARLLLVHGPGCDILHAQTAQTLTWLALLKPLLGRPVVYTRRTAFAVPARRQRRTLWKWRRADLLVAISEAAAAEPLRLGIAATLIPSAVEVKPADGSRARAFAQRLGLDGRKVLATAAALTREKDPCTLVRAVHALSQVRSDFVFVHLGASGDAEDEARALVRELGLESQYLFAGFEPDVEQLYGLMDVFVSSSRQEGLGTSVLDAFLYRVPVVATNAGGLAGLLDDGRGLACTVGDHTALAGGMARLLDDAQLRADMVERAHAYVLDRHDPARMAQRYLQAYEQLLAYARPLRVR